MTVDQRIIDEVLEAVWVSLEDHKTSIGDVRAICEHEHDGTRIDVLGALQEMEKMKLVQLTNGTVVLMKEGQARAQRIIRRHRLAERLFNDVLQMSETSMEITACRFEHILDSEVTDSVCAFLGHPPLCPHGKPIPPGDCCRTFEKDQVMPIVKRLSDMEPGKEGTIVFITPSFHKRFDRLTALGVIAGTRIKLHQKDPSFVVRLGETELAIDKSIACEIFVKSG